MQDGAVHAITAHHQQREWFAGTAGLPWPPTASAGPASTAARPPPVAGGHRQGLAGAEAQIDPRGTAQTGPGRGGWNRRPQKGLAQLAWSQEAAAWALGRGRSVGERVGPLSAWNLLLRSALVSALASASRSVASLASARHNRLGAWVPLPCRRPPRPALICRGASRRKPRLAAMASRAQRLWRLRMAGVTLTSARQWIRAAVFGVNHRSGHSGACGLSPRPRPAAAATAPAPAPGRHRGRRHPCRRPGPGWGGRRRRRRRLSPLRR